MDQERLTATVYEMPQKSQDILLVVPPTYPQGREPDYNPKPPLGLEYLASSAKEIGITASIVDYDVLGKSTEEVVESILELRPQSLGITTLQRALPSIHTIHTKLRNRGYDKLIIYGGIGATLSHREILREFKDPNCVVVLGEGEEVLPILMLNQQNDGNWRKDTPSIAYADPSNLDRIIVNPTTSPPNPKQLPSPDRQNYNYYSDKSGYGTFIGSRGCPWSKCTFCSNSAFEQAHKNKVWRPRNPEDVVDELIDLYQKFGTRRFKSNDPNLFGPIPDGQDHVIKQCQLLIEAKKRGDLPDDISIMSFVRGEDVAGQPKLLAMMKEAGWDRLLIGIESSSNFILDKKFAKGENIETLTRAMADMRDAGMSVVAGFMIFHPYSTRETIIGDLQFLHENNLNVTLAKSLRIFNGVPMQHTLQAEEKLVYNSPFETYHEYQVPEDVASLYYMLKNLHIFTEDPLRNAAQHQIWEIKSQGSSFNKRLDFVRLSQLTWAMESTLLEAGLHYQESRDQKDIARGVSFVYQKLGEIAQMLGFDGIPQDLIIDEDNFLNRTIEVLNQPPSNTLHEEYVWNKT